MLCKSWGEVCAQQKRGAYYQSMLSGFGGQLAAFHTGQNRNQLGVWNVP